MEFSAESLSPEAVTAFISLYGLKLVAALAIFVIGKWIVKKGTNFARGLMKKAKLDKTLVSFLGNIIYALGLTFVVIATLGQIGIETASLAAIIAAAGLAVGLALQGSLSNLAAGVMIILFRPFKVGDYIEAGGTAGSVEDISIFTTKMKTPDNKTVIVPNSNVTNSVITNYSAKDTRRIDMVFGIGYDDDIKAAKKLLEKIVKADKRVLKDPAPQIAVSELADSSVNFVVRPWVKSADFWAVKFDLTEKVKLEMDKAGISIPFPQRDVHLHAEDSIVKALAAANKNTKKKAA
jgi:small conductance mechanosensitive channel